MHLVVGDVHGCIEELKDLLEPFVFDYYDCNFTIVFAGDLIHKGPASKEVIEYIKNLQKVFNVVVVRGNHEEKHMRWHAHELRRGDKPNLLQHVEAYASMGLTTDDILWLEDSVFYYQFDNYIVTHAGIPSKMKTLPDELVFQTATGRNKNNLWQVLRIRNETMDGRMISLGDEGNHEHQFWAEKYDGRFGHCIFGHQPWLQDKPQVFPHATGIDLGCVHGKYLCALLIKGNERQVITVPAYQQYSETWKN